MYTTTQELFERFRAAYRSGEAVDPRTFLARVSDDDRLELEALILAFLEREPGRPADVERFRASPAAQRLRATVEERMAETWPELLPELRTQAELTRATLVQRLATALGVAEREPKVRRYYHRMETGDLAPSGVSDRVLEALGAVVGVSAARLRAAGRNAVPPALGGAVFARAAMPAAAAPVAAAPQEHEAEHDEVDELFTGASDPAA